MFLLCPEKYRAVPPLTVRAMAHTFESEIIPKSSGDKQLFLCYFVNEVIIWRKILQQILKIT